MYFRNIIFSAFAIALFSALILSVYQAYFITPLILGSEVYEVVKSAAHLSEELETWSPKEGRERHSWNFVSNFLVCFAYALILLSTMSMETSVSIVKGAFWGAAAYLSIFVAPALGLPPEIPGMEAAYLEGRQAWWLFTVVVTAFSLWLIAFKTTSYKCLGVCLIIIPHFIGAPQPEIHGFANTNPQAIKQLTELWHQFVIQTSLANALLWLTIGISSSILINKFIFPLATTEEKQY